MRTLRQAAARGVGITLSAHEFIADRDGDLLMSDTAQAAVDWAKDGENPQGLRDLVMQVPQRKILDKLIAEGKAA